MDATYQNKTTQRTLFWLKVYFFLLGIIFLLSGLARLGLERFAFLETILSKVSSEDLAADLTSLPALALGAAYALTGYGAFYAMAAVGAKEPPALGATRASLIATTALAWLTSLWLMVSGNTLYCIYSAFIAVVLSLLSRLLWIAVNDNKLWQVFGEPLRRSIVSWRVIITIAGLAGIILAALGFVYALVTDIIELPPAKPEPGELLYITTFDAFNDEWDLPQSSQKAEIIEGEMVLTEGSGNNDSGFYSLLEGRTFADMDLRVQTRQISGSYDNAYGVVFRRRSEATQNYYIFEISGDGYYRVNKVMDGVLEKISPWIPSDLIHQGTAMNEIRIVAWSDEFSFFINRTQVQLCTRGDNDKPLLNRVDPSICETNEWQMTWTDGTFKQGGIGVSVSTVSNADAAKPVAIGFDNLVITGPEAAQ